MVFGYLTTIRMQTFLTHEYVPAARLSFFDTPPPAPAGVAPYRLSDLQAELNRWGPGYFSSGGKQPLLHVTVLLLSLQFHAALGYLWRDEATKAFR